MKINKDNTKFISNQEDYFNRIFMQIGVILTETGKAFNEAYAIVLPMIIERINRVRELECNLVFMSGYKNQLTGFTIHKLDKP